MVIAVVIVLSQTTSACIRDIDKYSAKKACREKDKDVPVLKCISHAIQKTMYREPVNFADALKIAVESISCGHML